METPRPVRDLTQPIDPSADSKALEQIAGDPDPLSRIGVFRCQTPGRAGHEKEV